MAQEINLGGTIYISSKRAAEITGYTQDYIGQLARSEQIIAQRVSGLWYVVEESLANYKAKADEFKPTPPPPPQQDLHIESAVSFDGKDYVSAQRAAEITGYHHDYVSQLARTGKVLSRQVGNRWFVDRAAVVEHKRHNDALLAAVQAESVGLLKDGPVSSVPSENDLHFSYVREERIEQLPSIRNDRDIAENNDISDVQGGEESSDEPATEIPIRVITHETMVRTPQPHMRFERSIDSYRSSKAVNMIIIGTLVGLLFLGGGYLYLFSPKSLISAYTKTSDAVLAAAGAIPIESIHVPDFVRSLLSNELYYRRDDF